MPPELRNEYTAARLFNEVFSQRKPNACALLMAANAITHTPIGDFEGPAGFEEYETEVWNAYPEATFAIDDGVTDGELVTLHWSMGEAQPEQLGGVAILRFEQDMVADPWIEYGSATPAEQVDPNVAPELCPPCREP